MTLSLFRVVSTNFSHYVFLLKYVLRSWNAFNRHLTKSSLYKVCTNWVHLWNIYIILEFVQILLLNFNLDLEFLIFVFVDIFAHCIDFIAPGCWSRLVVVAATFLAQRRRVRVVSRPTISPSWARPFSATPTAPRTRMPSCRRGPISPVMIHTIVCLVLPMPYPPLQIQKKITRATIFSSTGKDHRPRRYRRAPRCRARRAQSATATAHCQTLLMAFLAMAIIHPTISQVRDNHERRSSYELFRDGQKWLSWCKRYVIFFNWNGI